MAQCFIEIRSSNLFVKIFGSLFFRENLWLGVCQFCHGKLAPAKRPGKGDFLVYYSPKHTMQERQLYQKFTAIGIITDSIPYQVAMGNGFAPFRRNVQYFDAVPVDIRPLIAKLPCIKNKTSWGSVFRYGFLEIDTVSFSVIADKMLGYDPLC